MRTRNVWWELIGAEEYRPIFSPNDNICPYYLISRKGQIYSQFSGRFLAQITTDRGYKVVSLDTVEGNRIQRRVHRLVMTTYHYFPGCEELEVDHVFGDKSDNWDEHLAWVTPKENTNRAINLGLRSSKWEDNPKAKITRDIALDAAQMVASGLSDQDVFNKYPQITFYMLQNIIQGNTWDIPQELIQKIHNIRHPIIVSTEDKYRICKWFQDNPITIVFDKIYKGAKTDYIKLCIHSLNLQNDMSVFRIVKRLFYRHQDSEITSLYNY